ncbi:hypothetical protein NLG97_g3792 [Lecanicillium saksenae]|uniref:Uncharacterized protein n=1 Tax=Lecanicillium saksenae TaxID=468837 RepID=A0ACC1QX30_9HYPO|nr:hypothetical protein NLG97_g3792 [Lecanicillium saksenae]
MDAKVWEVIPISPGDDGDENIPLYTGGIHCVSYGGAPREAAWTLSIDLPKNFTQFSARVPTVTAARIPSKGDLYNEMQQAQVVLPLTALFKAKDQRILQYLGNPFAKTVRSIAWYVEGIWQNGSNGVVSRSDKVSYGISKSTTDSMEHQTGISVTASGGIKLVQFEVNLSYQFTYSTSSTYNEFTNYEREEKFDVPAHYVTVMFCKRVRIQASYVNGTSISSADTLVSGEFHLSGAAL